MPPEASADRSRDDDAHASAHRWGPPPQLETQPGQQIDLPLGEPGAPLGSGIVDAATYSNPAHEPGAMDDALSDRPAVRPRVVALDNRGAP